MYLQDKKRYLEEKQQLSPEHRKMLRLHIRSKNLKKKGRPSAVLSSYMLFVKDKHADITKENPNSTFLQVGQTMGHMWRQMSTVEKAIYHQMHLDDKQRFANEMAVYAK